MNQSTKQAAVKQSTEVGAPAPDFTLHDAAGQPWRLSEQRGQVVVLLFYPGDETPICTRQMCSLRDRWEDYAATGAEVVGISTDSAESHRKFAEHHGLPLRLLSDTGGAVGKAYGVRSIIPGRTARAVFVVDARGQVSYRNTRALVGLLLPPKDDETITAIRKALQSAG
ncbi:MAG: peroxiredoxin family protein [Acidobacteriota bacterium]|nr:peroxiredoxin family protein [Acidobacteriota bacterium]